MSEQIVSPLERWPGYHEQSWQQRFITLDAEYQRTCKQMVDFAIAQAIRNEAKDAPTPAMTEQKTANEIVEVVARALQKAEWGEVARWDDLSADHHDYWRTSAQAAIAAARPMIEAEEREKCLAAIRGERLDDPQAGTDDDAYEQALDDVEAAIRAMGGDTHA